MADKHVVPVRAGRHRDRGRRGPERPACGGRAGSHAHARLQGGQCAACKSFVLDGDDDIELDRYSTFALPDYEKEEGYTLLCRAHAYEDLTIELLNYDEEMIRSGLPIQRGGRRGRRPTSRSPTTCGTWCSGWSSRDEIKFFPGQYIDIIGARHRGDPVVLDGEHLEPRERPARVRDQGLPGRPVLAVPGHQARGRRPARHRAGRSASSPCARAATST